MWAPTQLIINKYATVFVATFVLLLFVSHRKPRKSKLPLPPGPPRLPVIGSLLQMPLSHLWEKGAEWGSQYGDLVYLENVGVPAMIINSYETCAELLNKRSSIYSSRPYPIMTCDLAGWAYLTSILPYGDSLRTQRACLHRFFQTSKTLNYLELQERETFVMLNGLLEGPDKYEEHVRRLPGAVILRNAYGHEVRDEHDELIRLGETCMRAASDSLLYNLLDFLPWLKYIPEWFPGANFQTFAKESRHLAASLRSVPHSTIKKQLADGTGKECMASILLTENAEGGVKNEQEIIDAAATVFLAGSDTSVTAIMTFILAVLKNPDVQLRGQQEIDREIGPNRLPNLSDWDSLSYVRAICTEVLRWEVITPLVLPHFSTVDDEYNGHHIPKGTMILPNVWAISRDPARYPDPLAFKPERWLPGETSEGVPSVRPQEYAFGFGRRVCPGQNWAEHIIFIAVASILATFNIEKAIGPNGIPIPPNDYFEPTPIRTLGASKCKITPRSEKAVQLIRQAVAFL